MKWTAVALAILFTCTVALSQRPSDPALLVPQTAPELEYVAVANPVTVPAGITMGAAADAAFDSKGHLYVLPTTDGRFVKLELMSYYCPAARAGCLTFRYGFVD